MKNGENNSYKQTRTRNHRNEYQGSGEDLWYKTQILQQRINRVITDNERIKNET